MVSLTRTFTVLRLGVFVLLTAVTWWLWFHYRHGVHGDGAVWCSWSLLALLFGWSLVLYRHERPLAWLCWFTVLAVIYLALTDGGR